MDLFTTASAISSPSYIHTLLIQIYLVYWTLVLYEWQVVSAEGTKCPPN